MEEDTLGDLLRDAEDELRANDCPTLADAVKMAREQLSPETASGVYATACEQVAL